jgi:molybdate transport system substrate-binding protein
MRTRWWLGILLALGALAASACGGGGGGSSSSSSSSAGGAKPQLTVSAASSLKDAFTSYGKQFSDAKTRFSFAGSDALAAQIEQGVKPDVFAAANTKLPEQLYQKGLVEKPTVFAGNELVLAVPASGGKVHSLQDLSKSGVNVAIGEKDVPVGAYTQTVLAKMPEAQRKAILANVRSEEPDVSGVTGKLTQGAVDAGFLYISDVRATNGRLKAIRLPSNLQPQVAYGVAIVKGAKQPKQAQAFIDGLRNGAGEQALKNAGFEPPPAQ